VDAVARPAAELAIARVGLPGGGTAFAISDRLALTAFHVIGDRAQGTVRDRDLRLDFSGGSLMARVDDRIDPLGDVALLHLAGQLPPGAAPVALADAVGHEPWFARGFPVTATGAESLTVDGTVVDPDQHQPLSGASVIALYCRQAAAGSPQQLNGFSGAPVLIGRPPASAGLIRWNPTSPGQPGAAVGGTVYACPVRTILARWPELRSLAADRAVSPADAPEVAHVRRLIAQQEHNLRVTEMQASQYAAAERPLHLLNQLHAINSELEKLRGRLSAAGRREAG
jgi:hypothetical protein